MADEQQQGPRETAAGLQQGNEDPSRSVRGGGPGSGDAATQRGMAGERSTPDEQSTRAKSQRHGKVTADKWNQ